MNPNQLAQWLDFYKQNMAPPQSGAGDFYGGGSDPNAQANYRGAALNWAEKMANGGNQSNTPQPQAMPDFFANVPNGNPQAGNGVGAGPMPPQAGYNRLAQLMGRRY